MSNSKLVIAVPAYGESFYTPCVQSLYKLAVELARSNWQSKLTTISYADIAESRNVLLTHWFDETDASHLLFLDSDMGFEPQLILDMLEFNKPVVGTVYPKRRIDLDRFAKAISAGHSVEAATALAYDYVVHQTSRGEIVNGFTRVDSCGTGIFLIQRSCIETLISHLPDIANAPPQDAFKQGGRLIRAFDYITVDGSRLSEDFGFCHRWRVECGGEIWANISHPITHVGIQHFKARYGDVVNTGAAATADRKTKNR